LSILNKQLSAGAVIVGEIQYPIKNGVRPPNGRLIFSQANLTSAVPYEVLEFVQDDPGFPNDGTADQWFDVNRFNAYQELGRYLGTKAASAPG
jgi:hypothetical protein